MGVRTYLGSLVSLKKITHKHVSLFSLWYNTAFYAVDMFNVKFAA